MMLAWTIKASRWLATAAFSRLDKEDPEVSLPPLLALPQELLEHIITFLTLGETACLSLCNKRLRNQLGTPDRWNLLRVGHGHDDDRRHFLQQLARQDPTLFFCYACSCLHLVDRVGPALRGTRLVITEAHTSGPRPLCVAYPDWNTTPVGCFDNYDCSSSYSLTFSHVQLAMTRHRHGSGHGVPLHMLSLTEVQHNSDGIVFLLAVEPAIVKNELLLRAQQWLVYDSDNPPEIPSFAGRPNFCNHVNGFTTPLIEDILHCKERAQQHIQGSKPRCADVLWRCVRCAMEFELDAKKLEGGKQAVIITKWLNMGCGVTPDDNNWQQHLEHSYRTGENVVKVSRIGNSLKRCFEDQAIRSQGLVTDNNMSLLSAGAYQSQLREAWRRGTWLSK